MIQIGSRSVSARHPGDRGGGLGVPCVEPDDRGDLDGREAPRFGAAAGVSLPPVSMSGRMAGRQQSDIRRNVRGCGLSTEELDYRPVW